MSLFDPPPQFELATHPGSIFSRLSNGVLIIGWLTRDEKLQPVWFWPLHQHPAYAKKLVSRKKSSTFCSHASRQWGWLFLWPVFQQREWLPECLIYHWKAEILLYWMVLISQNHQYNGFDGFAHAPFFNGLYLKIPWGQKFEVLMWPVLFYPV